ncbi:MAG: hypothetical protein AB1894_28885 [Chloroflexota bacterium]
MYGANTMAEFVLRDSLAQPTIALFQQALWRGRVARLREVFRIQQRALKDTEVEEHVENGRNSHEAGVRPVPIKKIRANEARQHDFDRDFNPTNTIYQRRWCSVARAYLRGVALPAVNLLQVGDTYIVRDGHHRISVAKALGAEHIDARVIAGEMAA